MDTLHTSLFVACAAIAILAAAAIAVGPARWHLPAFGVLGLAVAGLMVALSATVVGLLALATAGIAGLFHRRSYIADGRLREISIEAQMGSALAGVAFLALAFLAFGDGGTAFGSGAGWGVTNLAALGVAIVGRSPLALAAALLAVVLVVGLLATHWSVRGDLDLDPDARSRHHA